MSQPDESGSPSVPKEAEKVPPPAPDPRIGEMMAARDAAQKQAMDLHSGFQELSRRAADLENQLGELDDELRKSREEAAALRRQVEESQEALTKLQQSRDRAEMDNVLLRLEAAEQKKRTAAVEPKEPETPPTQTVAASIPPPLPAPAAAPSAETTLRPQNLFGPDGDDGQPAYILHEIRSKDSLGVVYCASERSTGRKFAVRFMAGQAGEEQTQAIEREVEKLIALPHPNILHVQGSGRRKNRLYLAMDLVDAPTLGQAKISEIPRVCAIVRDAAAAVHYAHEEGIFHGDLTPENILVAVEDGKDLALVKEFGLGHLQEAMVVPGAAKDAAAVRNPAFLPPEQIRVLKSPLGAAIDVYGLGATLYAALAGRPPFEGKDPAQVAKRIMIEEPLPVEKIRPDVPEALGAIVRHAMAKERGHRYATAKELADALSKFLDGVGR